jgi:hypothetical protein
MTTSRGHAAIRPSPAMRRQAIGAPLLALVVATAACDTQRDPAEPPPGEPTFSAIHGAVLSRSCALAGCHAGTAPAAGLAFEVASAADVVPLCHTIVRRPSCLFPGRVLIAPGKPEASFLLDKLHGTGLEAPPSADCATTNQRMPLDQPPLGAAQLAQIDEWIRGGADCAGPPPVDAAIDADLSTPLTVLSIEALSTVIAVGGVTQVTVTVSRLVPAGGQTVTLTAADPTVLDVPATAQVEQGQTSVTVLVTGKRAAGPTQITAAIGDSAMSLTIEVTEGVNEEANGRVNEGVNERVNGPLDESGISARVDQATPTPGKRTPISS